MPTEKLFLDTSFVIALLNPQDDLHQKALEINPRYEKAKVWVTEAVLIEIGNAQSKSSLGRTKAVEFINECYLNDNIQVINVSTNLLWKALDLYKKRPDKTFGLVDCISFVVMEEVGITLALTYDLDFAQAGFTALLRV